VPPEFKPSAPHGFLARHAGCNKLFDLVLEVRSQLFVHLSLHGATSKQSAKSK
jgi:hypothetical protein